MVMMLFTMVVMRRRIGNLVSVDGVVPRPKSKETSVRGELDTVHWLLTVLVHPKHLPDHDDFH